MRRGIALLLIYLCVLGAAGSVGVTSAWAASAAPYYVEFRAVDIGVYGHSYIAYGRLKANGQPSTVQYADFHPKGAMSEKYGVYLADKGITGRAIAIVNKAGNVAWFKNYDIPVVPDVKEVAAALGQVKAVSA